VGERDNVVCLSVCRRCDNSISVVVWEIRKFRNNFTLELSCRLSLKNIDKERGLFVGWQQGSSVAISAIRYLDLVILYCV